MEASTNTIWPLNGEGFEELSPIVGPNNPFWTGFQFEDIVDTEMDKELTPLAEQVDEATLDFNINNILNDNFTSSHGNEVVNPNNLESTMITLSQETDIENVSGDLGLNNQGLNEVLGLHSGTVNENTEDIARQLHQQEITTLFEERSVPTGTTTTVVANDPLNEASSAPPRATKRRGRKTPKMHELANVDDPKVVRAKGAKEYRERIKREHEQEKQNLKRRVEELEQENAQLKSCNPMPKGKTAKMMTQISTLFKASFPSSNGGPGDVLVVTSPYLADKSIAKLSNKKLKQIAEDACPTLQESPRKIIILGLESNDSDEESVVAATI